MSNDLKKIIISILFTSVFLIGNGALAKEITDSEIDLVRSAEIGNQNFVSEQNSFFVDSHIKKELKTSIQNVYGQDRAEEVYNNLIEPIPNPQSPIPNPHIIIIYSIILYYFYIIFHR